VQWLTTTLDSMSLHSFEPSCHGDTLDSCRKSPSLETYQMMHASKAGSLEQSLGWQPSQRATRHRPVPITGVCPIVAVENSVCLKQPICQGRMPIHGTSKHRPSVYSWLIHSRGSHVVLALKPTQGNVVHAWFEIPTGCDRVWLR